MFKIISSSVVEMFWSYIFSNHELIYFANGHIQMLPNFSYHVSESLMPVYLKLF